MTYIPERADLLGTTPVVAEDSKERSFIATCFFGLGMGFAVGIMTGAVGVDRMNKASTAGVYTFLIVWALFTLIFPLVSHGYSSVVQKQIQRQAAAWHRGKEWLSPDTEAALSAVEQAKQQGVDDATLNTMLASLVAVNEGAPHDSNRLTAEQQDEAILVCQRVEQAAAEAVERELYVTEERRALEATMAKETETAAILHERTAFESQLAVAQSLLSDLPAPLELETRD